MNTVNYNPAIVKTTLQDVESYVLDEALMSLQRRIGQMENLSLLDETRLFELIETNYPPITNKSMVVASISKIIEEAKARGRLPG